MHSVTSNAVAEKFSDIGTTVTLLKAYTSYSTSEITLADSIENFKSIVVEVGNNESPSCKCAREYNSKLLQDNLLNDSLQDFAGFNDSNNFYVRYAFTSKTKFKLLAFNGSWTFGTCKVWGIR